MRTAKTLKKTRKSQIYLREGGELNTREFNFNPFLSKPLVRTEEIMAQAVVTTELSRTDVVKSVRFPSKTWQMAL